MDAGLSCPEKQEQEECPKHMGSKMHGQRIFVYFDNRGILVEQYKQGSWELKAQEKESELKRSLYSRKERRRTQDGLNDANRRKKPFQRFPHFRESGKESRISQLQQRPDSILNFEKFSGLERILRTHDSRKSGFRRKCNKNAWHFSEDTFSFQPSASGGFRKPPHVPLKYFDNSIEKKQGS